MVQTITISQEEYTFLKKNVSTKIKLNQLSLLGEKSFTKDWDSKEDGIWDTY